MLEDYVRVFTTNLNRDTLTDLAVTIGSQLFILAGQVDGSFGAPEYTDLGSQPADMKAADLNHDGVAELVTVNSDLEVVSVWFRQADKRLSHREFPLRINGRSIAIADFDGDGHSDVFVADDYRTAMLLGDGHLGLAPPILGSGPSGITGMQVADFNRDGLPDVDVSGKLTNLILVNRGAGRLEVLPRLMQHGCVNQVLDLNADLLPDKVCLDDHSLRVILNDSR